jgi:hypothetical protein
MDSRDATLNRHVVALWATAALLAGCTALPSERGALSQSSRVFAAEATPPPNCGRYGPCSVDSCFGTVCIAYSTEGEVQAELTSGIVYAQGVAADRHGNAYIADSAGAAVFEYGPYLKPFIKTYEDDGEVPLDVAVNEKIKLLAVSNQSTGSSGPGSVSVYAGGSLTPTATLSDPGVPSAQGIGIAIDGLGNCFWSLYDPKSGRSKIDEFLACAGSPLTIASGKHALRGMALDKRNNLYYIIDVSPIHHDIYKCRGTSHCRTLATDFAKPVMLGFDDKWGFLWTDDAGTLEGPLIESINPRDGQVVSSFRAGSSTDPPFGIAIAPGPAY